MAFPGENKTKYKKNTQLPRIKLTGTRIGADSALLLGGGCRQQAAS